MIINQEKSQANIIGEVQSNKVNIDVNNINFITSLLTSNLYSKPIQSFLRETVANAWDSQVEANNIDTPILIKIDSINENDIEIAVRDYGTGLSPERFNEIYKNIGSSTKRESNDYVGCLGIGRFASLAVNDTVSIKSYYNGKLYNYLMYKDGESLNIDLLNTTDTEYDNGVEVKVTIKDGYCKRFEIINGLAALAYFEQIYISTNVYYLEDFTKRFNRRTIHEFENFKVCSLSEISGLHFLMGNVLYENTNKSFVEFANNPSIAIKCFIGEVDVTPNRESLRFNERTTSVLEYKLKVTNEEIYKKAQEFLEKDFKTIYDYKETICANDLHACLWYFKEENYYINVRITDSQRLEHNLTDNCTIRGKKIPDNLIKHYNFINHMNVPYNLITYFYNRLQFCKSNGTCLRSLKDYAESNNIYVLKEPFKPYTKQYLKEYLGWRNVYFIKEDTFKNAYKELFSNYIKWLKTQNWTFSKELFLLIAEEYFEAFKNLKSFNNSDVPKDWLDAQKVQRERSKRRDFVIHTLYMGRQGVTTNNKKTFKDIMHEETTIIYDEINSEYLRSIFEIFSNRGMLYKYTFIEVAKNNIPTLQKYKRFIHINDFTTKYQRVFSKLFTSTYIDDNIEALYTKYPLYDDYGNLIKKYTKIVSSNSYIYDKTKDFKELYEYYISKNWLDWSLINEFSNPDIKTFSNYLKGLDICSYSNIIASKIAINYFVYKHNIHIGNLNKRTAYKFLKTI